jgi:hypothetical protein
MQRKRQIVILPYYCQEEIVRYLKIAEKIASFPSPAAEVDYLLAASPRAERSQSLYDAYNKIGNAISFQCPTQIFGYPEGPTAMFWDCMDYVAEHYQGEDGFSLWLESDMAPTQPDWIDRLSDQWYSHQERPIMMGCYVPEVYKSRLFKKRKLLLEPHINGGACYSMDFVNHMPAEARNDVFDMAVFQYAQSLGRAVSTHLISFSTSSRVRRDLLDQDKVLLHGFMQEKDSFVDQCLAPLSAKEISAAPWNGTRDQIETLRRRLRVWFVRKGREAMLENMFLAKAKFDSTRAGQPLPAPVKRAA